MQLPYATGIQFARTTLYNEPIFDYVAFKSLVDLCEAIRLNMTERQTAFNTTNLGYKYNCGRPLQPIHLYLKLTNVRTCISQVVIYFSHTKIEFKTLTFS